MSCPCSHYSLMFWTNWNEQSPSIMRASLNGANVLVIIGKDIKTPNGLAIDHRAEKLYFSDATLDKIERCEYDGSSRYVRYPFGFFFSFSCKGNKPSRLWDKISVVCEIMPAIFCFRSCWRTSLSTRLAWLCMETTSSGLTGWGGPSLELTSTQEETWKCCVPTSRSSQWASLPWLMTPITVSIIYWCHCRVRIVCSSEFHHSCKCHWCCKGLFLGFPE